MATITITVQSLLNAAQYDTYTVSDGITVAVFKVDIQTSTGVNQGWFNLVFDDVVLNDGDTLFDCGIIGGSILRSGNIIDSLPTLQDRQVAKLDLASLDRSARGNPYSTYDIDLLPSKYIGNVSTPNIHPTGLVEGRPWLPSVVTTGLQLYLNAADPASYPGSGTTWTDLSANGYLTTLVGAPAFNISYFAFDGSTEYVDTNQSLTYESFSVGAWFRTSAGGIKMILSKESTVGNPWNYRIWLNDGQIVADISQVSTQSSLSSPLSTYNNGNWYYVMFTRDDSNWYIYVNGSQVNTKLDTFTGPITNSQELWVGLSAYTGVSPNGSYQYTGDIGQVFVYDRALTPSEITQNWDATRSTYGL